MKVRLVMGVGCLVSALFAASTISRAEDADCPGCPQMKVIAAGAFEMGAEASDSLASEDEHPRHRVTIAKSFAIGMHEVTRAQFAAFVEATKYDAGNSCNALEKGQWADIPGRNWRDPGYAQTSEDPVVCVSWNDAQAYARWLTQRTGKPYRLLSEAEWEYVARTGLTSSSPLSHETANYGAETDTVTPLASGRDRWLHTAPVGSFPPDALGLYDIRGNVWEWLQDCYHENYEGAPVDGTARESGCSMADRRAVRGGGWGDSARLLRTTYRLRGPAAGRYFSLGFRVARDLEKSR